jgi:NAD(P)-dependent dehydrogenase (short-subunit alcohol dehydrogenase family)
MTVSRETDKETAFEWRLDDLAEQRDRTFIVTGATSGLGLVVARVLVHAGAHVILAVRDLIKAEQILPLITSGGTGHAEVRELDVASMSSVNAFADALAGDGVQLTALVNNAGVSVPTFRQGADGIELTTATNVVGPAILAERLLPLFAGPAPRVVLVGSNFSQRTRSAPDLDRMSKPEEYRQLRQYTASKVLAAAWAVDFSDRLAAIASPVRSVIAHPGVARTGMSDQAGGPVAKALASVVVPRIARTPEDGARAILFAATAPDVPERVFIGPGLRRSDARLHVVPVRGAAADPAFRSRVREFVSALSTAPA